MFRITIIKLSGWLFSRMLVSHAGGLGSIPGRYISPGTSSLRWRWPWSSLFIVAFSKLYSFHFSLLHIYLWLLLFFLCKDTLDPYRFASLPNKIVYVLWMNSIWNGQKPSDTVNSTALISVAWKSMNKNLMFDSLYSNPGSLYKKDIEEWHQVHIDFYFWAEGL